MNSARSRTADALARLAAGLRRWTWLSALLLGLGLATAVLGAGAWLLRLRLAASGPIVLAAWLVALAGAGLAAWWWWSARRSLAVTRFAARLERLGAARAGALTAQVDRLAGGTSEALAAEADRTRAEALLRDAPAVLDPVLAGLRRRTGWLAAGLLVSLTVLAAARPLTGVGTSLWRPALALESLLAPVSLRADRTLVSRGEPVVLTMMATGRRRAVLWYRAPGEVWVSVQVMLDSTGRADTTLAGLDQDLHLHLTSGTRSSDTLVVRVRPPAFLGAMTLTARYPAYLGLEDQQVDWTGGAVLLPDGTAIEADGVSSVPLREAGWAGPGGPHRLAVEQTAVRGRFRPAASGDYRLDLATADGTPLAGDPPLLRVVLVPDSAPQVELLAPATDTLLPAGGQLRLVADLRDDHGLAGAAVVVRQSGSPRTERHSIGLPEGMAARALVTHQLDLSARVLAPGDTVYYRIEAVDNTPQGQRGSTREFRLVVPTQADERAAQRAASSETGSRLDSLVAAARQLQRETEALAAQRSRPASGRGEQAMGFEAVERAEAVARSQEALLDETAALEETLDALREAVDRGGLQDSALAARLEEVRNQLARALTPEMRQRLEELQRAIQNLDPQAAREALQRLSEAQQALREALERSRDLFERAALEGELQHLEQTARDVAARQDELNRQVGQADSSQAAARQDALAARTDSLAGDLDRAAERLDLAQAREAMDQAADQSRQAAARMRQAAQASRDGQRQQARAAGEQAESMMQQVGEETEAQRQAQQDVWREEVMQALDRALAETARLSRDQLAVTDAFRRAAGVAESRRVQAGIEESVEKLAQQVRAVSGQNALVSPQISVALTVARRHMAQAREAVSSATPNPREATEQAGQAVDALNVAAFGLVRSREDVSGAGSGSGMAEAMERMSQAAQQQGQMAQDAASMLPQAGMAAIQMELQRLAAQQQAMARQLERMRAEGQIPGTREMAEEARDLARRLDQGQLDPETVARQERLFRRMLDAGRTLEGEERDERKERQSTTARDVEIRLPPALVRRLGGTIRVPTWEELRQLPPEERQLVTEYFRRLAGGVP